MGRNVPMPGFQCTTTVVREGGRVVPKDICVPTPHASVYLPSGGLNMRHDGYYEDGEQYDVNSVHVPQHGCGGKGNCGCSGCGSKGLGDDAPGDCTLMRLGLFAAAAYILYKHTKLLDFIK